MEVCIYLSFRLSLHVFCFWKDQNEVFDLHALPTPTFSFSYKHPNTQLKVCGVLRNLLSIVRSQSSRVIFEFFNYFFLQFQANL